MYTHTRGQSTHGVHSDARSWQDLPPEHTTVYLNHTYNPQQPLHHTAQTPTPTHTKTHPHGSPTDTHCPASHDEVWTSSCRYRYVGKTQFLTHNFYYKNGYS